MVYYVHVAAAAVCRVTVSSSNQRSRPPFHQSTGIKLVTLRKDEVRNWLYTDSKLRAYSIKLFQFIVMCVFICIS